MNNTLRSRSSWHIHTNATLPIMKAFPLIIILLQSLQLFSPAEEKNPAITESVIQAQSAASAEYWKEKLVIQKSYQKLIAEMVLKADRIEIFLLDFSMQEVNDQEVETFPIPPLQGDARVLAKKEVQASELESFKAATAAIFSTQIDSAGGAFCHYPIHGIRVYHAGVRVFQTSLCWNCGNYYMEYPDGTGFDNMTAGASRLRELFDQVLPIPPKEIVRFKSAIKDMNSKNKDKSHKKK